MLTSQEWPGNSPKESEGTAVLMFTTWQAEASDGLHSPGSWVATSVCILGDAQRRSVPPSSDSLLLRSAKTPEISQW